MNLTTELAVLWPGEPQQSTIGAQLEWLEQCEPFFRLESSHIGIPLNEWMDSAFPATIATFCDDIDTRKAVGASLWLKSFSAHLLTGMAALRLKFARVPCITVSQISLEVSSKGKLQRVAIDEDAKFFCLADDVMADSPLAIVVASEQRLDQQFALILQQLGDYLAPYYKHENVSRNLFWGHWGYAVGLSFQKLTQHGSESTLLETLQPEADRWLKSLLPNTANLNSVKVATREPVAIYYIRRETCCLKYKLDGKKNCATCQLIDPEEQLIRYQSKIPE
ncbi:(2Fe-2S)-binding protein [Photobacterium nomapromontoriensis]|uniref:(2Fe-2S)-binding protein n=1 Tax=Photobacterium nomapromontoriensis TaxID=2910237 RepID=UPI003D0C8960